MTTQKQTHSNNTSNIENGRYKGWMGKAEGWPMALIKSAKKYKSIVSHMRRTACVEK